MIYDADGKSPAWYGADPNDDIAYASDIPEENYINAGVLGTIPGSTGFDQSLDIRYSNPFALTPGSPTWYQVKPGNNDCHNVFLYGYVHLFKDGLYTITTQNLSAGFTGFDDENYFDMDVRLEGRSFVIVKDTRNGISVESGTIENLKTYEEAGVDCSRVLLYFGSTLCLSKLIYFYIKMSKKTCINQKKTVL